MTGGHVLDPRSLARIAGVASAVTAMIAAVATFTVAAQTRRWLGFTFTGVPPRIDEAGAILLNNGRFVIGMAAAACVAQFRLRRRSTGERTGTDGVLALMALAADVAVGLAVLINAALVGLAVGGYGWRTLAALLPHGPFEVCSYCIAINVFLTARRRRISRREWVAAGLVSLSLLSLAAVLETFTWLG